MKCLYSSASTAANLSAADLYHRVVLGETEFMLYASTCTHNKSHDLKKRREGEKNNINKLGGLTKKILFTL